MNPEYSHSSLPETFQSMTTICEKTIAVTRSRLLCRKLAVPLNNWPILPKTEISTIQQFIKNAQTGFKIQIRQKDLGNISKKFFKATKLQESDTTDKPFSPPEDTYPYLTSFFSVAATLGELREKRSVSFFDMQLPHYSVQLGEMDYLQSHWNFPENAEGLWSRLQELDQETSQVLLQKNNVPTQTMLKVGHFYSQFYGCILQASETHVD